MLQRHLPDIAEINYNPATHIVRKVDMLLLKPRRMIAKKIRGCGNCYGFGCQSDDD